MIRHLRLTLVLLVVTMGVASCSLVLDGTDQRMPTTSVTPSPQSDDNEKLTVQPNDGVDNLHPATPHGVMWPQNAECEPPCWGQLVPGKTPLDEALVILRARADTRSVTESSGEGDWYGLINWEGEGLFGHAIATESSNETITYISIDVSRPIEFRDVRAVYGDPTHVQFWYDSEIPEYLLTLIYADRGFALGFVTFVPNGSDQPLDDAEGTLLEFFAPKSLEGYMNVRDLRARSKNLVDWEAGKGLKYYCEQAYRGDSWTLDYCPE